MPRLGGTIEMSVEVAGERRPYGGPVIAFEPGPEISAAINWHGAHAWPVPMFWTFRLTPLYGGTQVDIFHHGFESWDQTLRTIAKAMRTGGISSTLKALRAIVEGPGPRRLSTGNLASSSGSARVRCRGQPARWQDPDLRAEGAAPGEPAQWLARPIR